MMTKNYPNELIEIAVSSQYPDFKFFTIPGRTMQMMMFPRSRRNEMPEDRKDRNAVYILYGVSDDDTGDMRPASTRNIYIGETTHVLQRLNTHHARKERAARKSPQDIKEEEQMYSYVSPENRGSEKDFWEHTVVFTSSEDDLSIDRIKYIEAKLIDRLNSLMVSEKEKREFITRSGNHKNQNLPHMSIAKCAATDRLIETMLILLDCAGLDFFKEAVTADVIMDETDEALNLDMRTAHRFTYTFTPHGLQDPVSGRLIVSGSDNSTYYLEKGSVITSENKSNLYSAVVTLKELLRKEGKLRDMNDGRLELLSDVMFTNISYAAALVSGHTERGPQKWISDENGRTFEESFE